VQPMQTTADPSTTAGADTLDMDLLIVGAGLSGIGAARHLQAHSPSTRWGIVEARERLGGTWDLFRYPGVRSDSDMHTLGYAFKPWTERKAIADGPSILRYIQNTADEAGITPQIQFGRKVLRADWSTAQSRWQVTLSQTDGTLKRVNTQFLYLCSGYYSYTQAHQPTFEGQSSFQGTWVHPQFWPKDLDYSGKKVVVIGSGATAATLVPAMASTAAHVTMLQRSPTYMVSRPAEDALALKLQRFLPESMAHHLTRWKNILMGMFFFQVARRYPQKVKNYLIGETARRLNPDFDTAKHFTPRYNPWDQRICLVPNGDMFRALRKGQASIVTDTIARITPDGITLASGEHLAADIIVSATGLHLNALGGMALSVDGQDYSPAQAMAYKGMMLSDLPNVFVALGYTNASWTLKADLTAGYVCRLLNYMQDHGLTQAVPRKDPLAQSRPYFDFSSGYVQRAASELPKQGDRGPWRVHQNYLADMLNLRWGRLEDGVLQLTGQGKAAGAAVVAAKND
jgi:monooxygenase